MVNMEWLDSAVNELSWKLAEQREDRARFLVRKHLPKRLEWLADHPRLLRVAYFLRRKWRPTLYMSTDLNCTVVTGHTPDNVMVVVGSYFSDTPPS